ncbi:hypothetical protein EV421DRAFT_1287755 [Armillaria borealis]|uniref:Secreted protein n=1 Tax=Armillaria borealis TaxID=47425 RepID=A0AA39M5N8_9AGAR|nr:hypothetical protein EV421DRAFT_1287755 [Armillaria borealis]
MSRCHWLTWGWVAFLSVPTPEDGHESTRQRDSQLTNVDSNHCILKEKAITSEYKTRSFQGLMPIYLEIQNEYQRTRPPTLASALRPHVVVPVYRFGNLFRYMVYRFLMVAFAHMQRAIEL